MILSDYLFGVIEDNVRFFSLPKLVPNLFGCSNLLGYPSGVCQKTSVFFQPLINIPAYFLAQIFNPVVIFNLLIILAFFLNLVFSFKFFRKLFDEYISGLISLIFVLSPYLVYQSRSHYELIQLWPFILYIDVLFFNKSKYKSLILGLLLTFITGISYYLGFFTIIFSILHLLTVFVISKNKKELLKNNIPTILRGVLVFFLTSMIFLYPYVSSNYFKSDKRGEVSSNSKTFGRPLEDFIIFSSRPWYFLLPSVDNPFFGPFSEKVLDRMSASGNYLTQSYFKSEHSALFLGWFNIMFALLGMIFLFKNSKKEYQQFNYVAVLIAILTMILITSPPTFVLKGIIFYSPSFILFKVFPMFRVLARMGVLILFFILIFTGFGYIYLVKLIENKDVGKKVANIFLIPIVLFSLSQFVVPIKVTHVSEPPEVYKYIKENINSESPLVIYPYNKTSDAVFWLNEYKQPLINPRSHEDVETGFYSEEFTESLNTEEGLQKAKNMGAKYLIYFYEADKDKSLNFFDNSNYIEIVGLFPGILHNEKNYFNLLRIIEAGGSVDNSSLLYSFR